MTAERAAELKAMYDDLNFVLDTSDIPEWTAEDFKNAIRGRSTVPSRSKSSPVIDWLKKQGKGYQSCMNAILRREMLASFKSSTR